MTTETGPDPVTLAEEPSPADTDRPGRLTRLRRAGLSLSFLLLVLAVVFVALGVVFQVRHHSRPQASDNVALVDAAATSEVVGQVTSALNDVLSYDYTNPTPTQQAAQADLTGDAAKQYQTLFSDLRAKAPGAQLTLKTDVGQVGVISLQGNDAQLLVFLTQTSTRASDKTTTGPQPAQLRIAATFTGNRWKISELQTL